MESELTVLKGVFQRPRKVEKRGIVVSVEGKQFTLNRKSLWGILRHHCTRKIDKEIKSQKRHGVSLEDFFIGAFRSHKLAKKEMQFFVDIKKEKCMACATPKHTVIVPDKVYETFNKILKKKSLALEDKESIGGKILILQKTKLMKLGMQIDAGDTITSKAIRIIGFAEILACCNPLAFAKLNRGILMGEFEPIKVRILRYESITTIESRIDEAIETVKPILIKVQSKVDATKKKHLTIDDTRKIIVSFCGVYGIGAKAISAVYNRFKNEEAQTQWGLSMALSFIVEHSDVFRKDSSDAKNNLATIAGAVLLADDLKKTVKLCERQIKKEPALQVIEAKILGKIPLNNRVKKK